MPSTIRRLLDSDRNDILEISRHIWEGHDYLLSVADKWLKDPKCQFYGVEVEGRIVAVGNLRLMEDGRTGWMEGLRVHPECRGKGYANEITQYLVRKAECLRVNRLRYTTSVENAASVKLAELAGFSKLFEMAVFWHPDIQTMPPIRGNHPIERPSPARAYALQETNPSMIPYGILVYDWKALDSTLENFEEIGLTHEFYVSLKDGADSLSFGYPRPEPTQVSWSSTIYALDTQGFLSQLSHNITIALEHGLKSIVCTFETVFEETLNQLDQGPGEHWGTHLVLFEKQMQKRGRHK